ncbi:MAG: AAA family ATPase [Pseudanabaenaceae cyanobacterium]
MSDRSEAQEPKDESPQGERSGAQPTPGDGLRLESWTDLLNLDRLLELANQVEGFQERWQERLREQGGQVTGEVRFRSSIPPRGNIPRTVVGRSARVPGVPKVTPPPQAPAAGAPESGSLTERVGGLGAIAQQLREYVEIPLKRPDVLQQLGLEPPKGVLLVGPPGTGKTLVARSLAATLGVAYLSLVGPEILSKYYGEAEAKLREVFAQAAAVAPCLIFIDEIDALAPNRANVEGEVEKRLVAQLLGLMDGFQPSGGVVVLAATNRPDALDPALRRPGRFDREIVFPVPDEAARREILAIQCRNMPLAADVNLDEWAARTRGFVGADLKGLCQAAALHSLQRQVPNLQEVPAVLTVTAADFAYALTQVQPAALRAMAVESPNVPWSSIGGLAAVKATLQEAIEGAFLQPELYRQARAQAPRGILLWGPPGTGKTLLAKAIATAGQTNFIAVNGPELMSKWVGATEQAIRHLFATARQAAPCTIFIDELDTLAPARGQGLGDSGVGDRAIGQLLVEMDGLQSGSGILVVAATNRREAIDPALLRSGRLELHLEIGLPNAAERLAILTVHNRDRPLAADVDLEELARQTEGYSGADLAFVSNRAAIAAIRRHRAHNDPQTPLQITAADFAQAQQELPTS